MCAGVFDVSFLIASVSGRWPLRLGTCRSTRMSPTNPGAIPAKVTVAECAIIRSAYALLAVHSGVERHTTGGPTRPPTRSKSSYRPVIATER
jgi:hypothetical protein